MTSKRSMLMVFAYALAYIFIFAHTTQPLRSEGDKVAFRDPFRKQLRPGWSWIRGHETHRRMTDEALEIRLEPGNMWGRSNDARNVLVRDIPKDCMEACEIEVTVFNQPAEQYEQVDLVWYYNDSYQVKIGQELVDGQLSIVMGREENDHTRTIAIIPLNEFEVSLKLNMMGGEIQGSFKKKGSNTWIVAGKTDLPVHGTSRITIQCYQGPSEVERWAQIRDFSISRAPIDIP